MDKYQSEGTDKLTPGEARFFKTFGRWFLRIGGAVICALFIVFAALLGRLAVGPIDLNFLRPEIEQTISGAEIDLDVEFSTIEMVWDRWLRPYEIVVKNIQISDPGEKKDTLTISEVGLSVWIEKLISGRFEIRNLFIYSPKLILNRTPETGFMLKLDGNAESKSMTFEELTPLFIMGQGEKDLGSLANLNKIVITDAQVTLQDDTVGEIWKLPKITFILNRYQEGFRLRSSMKSTQSSLFAHTLDMELKHRLGSSRLDMALDFKKANFAELIGSNKSLFDDDTNAETDIEKVLEFLYGLDFPIKGRVQLAIVPQTGQLIEGEARLQTGAGTIFILGEKIPLNGISFHADIDHSLVDIDRLQIQLADTKLLAKAKHQANGGPLLIHKWLGRGASLNASMTASKISLDSLAKLWPKSVASSAREWITEEVMDGSIPSLKLDLESHVDELSNFVVKKLGGEFSIESLQINYLDDLPHAKKVTGTAKFDNKGFVIDITDGYVQGLEVSKGKILITDLDTDDEGLELDFNLQGPLADVLDIIDHDPLGYATKAKLDPKKTSGYGNIQLHMSFPLLSDLKFQDIKLNATGEFKDVDTTLDIGDPPLRVANGDIKVQVDEKHLSASGIAQINQLSSKVKGLVYFTDPKPKPWEVQIVVDTIATETDFKRLGYDYTAYIKGKAETKLTFEHYGKDNSTLGIGLGLKGMAINVPHIGWSKPVGGPASLAFVIGIDKKGFDKVEDISLHSDYITAKGTGDFGEDLQVHAVYLTSVQAPYTLVDIAVIFNKEGGYDLHFEGKQLNVEPFMNFLNDGEDGPTLESSYPINISSNVDILRMTEDAEFNDVSSSVKLLVEPDNIQWIKVKLNASTGKGTATGSPMGSEKSGISFGIEPAGNGGQTLEIHADDAGKLFKNLAIYDKVLGGKMEVKAKREAGQPFIGKFKIENFDAEQIPLAGRLASVLSPMGIVNLFSGDGRLTINKFSCDFTFSEEEVTFKEGVGKSIGLGFTSQGKLDRINRMFDIKGNVIPAYVLNSILDNIPIVGSLLTGGKGEGIFAIAYTVDGPMDHPNVNVNPLTALAPGFIRNLFED